MGAGRDDVAAPAREPGRMRTSTSRPGERRRDVHSFERRARRYERDWRSAFHARVVTAAAEVALRAVPHPAAVLDVGCGTGALLRALAERLPAGVELCGVDPAPSMLQVGGPRSAPTRACGWSARPPSGCRSMTPASTW
jgi:SAM-dependent methyltransferase